MAESASTILDRIIKNSRAIEADAAALKAGLPPTPIPPTPTTKLTDRIVRMKPTPKVLGPAGSIWPDPIFGSQILRVTDALTEGGASCHAMSSIGGSWNKDGSRFVITNTGGGVMFYAFDGQKTTRLPTTIKNQAEPWFSYADPNIIYHNQLNQTTGSYRMIKKFNISTGIESTVLDLDALYSDKNMTPEGYIGPLVAVDDDVLCVLFGGLNQDSHFLIHHSKQGLIDYRTLDVQSDAGLYKGAGLHGFGVDRTGRLILAPSQADRDAHPGTSQLQVYDPSTKKLAPLTNSMKGGGHWTAGYGQMINQDCCTSSNWDAGQWQWRSLDNLGGTKDLIVPILTPPRDHNLVQLSDHSDWRNARPDVMKPILSSLFRKDLGTPVQPWRAWDDEIIFIHTDGSNIVERICHHQSIADNNYYTQANAHLNPQGTHAIFNSNWGKTVGLDRVDTFLVSVAS